MRPRSFILCPLERLPAIPADYIDLPRCPDDGSAAGADIFNAAVLGFFTSAFGGTFHRQAAGVVFIFAQGFPDPYLCLRGQCRYCPSVFIVLLNVQAMSLSGSFEFQVVIIAVVTFVLDAMNQIVEVRHFM